MALLIVWLFLLAISIPITLYRAYVLTCLWAWFVVPLFDVPKLGVLYAVGILTLVSLFQQHKYEHKDEQDREQDLKNAIGGLAQAVVIITIVWGFAYIVHLIAG